MMRDNSEVLADHVSDYPGQAELMAEHPGYAVVALDDELEEIKDYTPRVWTGGYRLIRVESFQEAFARSRGSGISTKMLDAITDANTRHCGITVEVHSNRVCNIDADLDQPHGLVVMIEVSHA